VNYSLCRTRDTDEPPPVWAAFLLHLEEWDSHGSLPHRISLRLFLFHRNQFTVKPNVVLADGLVASELLSVNPFTVTV